MTGPYWNLRITGSPISRTDVLLVLLMHCHIAIVCLSLVQTAFLYHAFSYVFFDAAHVRIAATWVGLFAIASIFFVSRRFSFGYVVGIYFCGTIAAYLWLLQFSRLDYDHWNAGISAFTSAVAFLTPATLMRSPLRRRLELSKQAFKIILYLILVVSAMTLATAALYNFKLVELSEIYSYRDQIQLPAMLRYAIGMTSSALLPFAFASFFMCGHRWLAGLTLVFLLLFYPVTLSKLTLFAPLWLAFLVLLSKLHDLRFSVVLSLLLPTLVGVSLMSVFDFGLLRQNWMVQYFGTVNFRMLAIPAVALDYYNNYFATHPHTHFCQIRLLRALIDCPYKEDLALVMAQTYQLGNFNASLFATEGIASVGIVGAPLVALGCGMVFGLANCLSADLPPRFVFVSSGVLTQVFLNVPLTIALVSNGAALLFLLWYVVPREVFGGAVPVDN
jgi:hypothetical protein